MPIIHYPGYITKEEFAKTFKVQVRTVNDWIRKTSPAPEYFSYLKVDGHICIKDPFYKGAIPPGMTLNTLEWVRNFGKRNKMFFERIYEGIIQGKISGVILNDRIFVNNADPQLAEFTANYKRRRK